MRSASVFEAPKARRSIASGPSEKRVLPDYRIRPQQYSLGSKKIEVGLPVGALVVTIVWSELSRLVTGDGSFELHSVIMVGKEFSYSF